MKTIIKISISFYFIISIAILMSSCGARKVQKSESKEETKNETLDNSVIEKQAETNIKTTVETKTDDKNEIVTQETIFEPINSSKESFVIEKDGTKLILNNAKKIVRNTMQNNNTVTSAKIAQIDINKESVKEQKDIKQQSVSNKENNSKNIEKKQFNPMWWYICMAIFLILLVIAYFVLKRLKVI